MYDYRNSMKEDILAYIEDNDVLDYEYEGADELRDILMDELWADDTVTGNGPYGYDGPAHCEQYICDGNLKLLSQVIEEFEMEVFTPKMIRKADFNVMMQQCDAAIRCYLLPYAIDDALEELGLMDEEEDE